MKTIIEAEKNFIVVGEACTAEESIELVRELQPDMMVADLSLPGKSDITHIQEMKTVFLVKFSTRVSM